MRMAIPPSCKAVWGFISRTSTMLVAYLVAMASIACKEIRIAPSSLFLMSACRSRGALGTEKITLKHKTIHTKAITVIKICQSRESLTSRSI